MRAGRRLAPVVIAGLIAGGIAGAGAGLGWYGPVVAVGLAGLIGLAVGAYVYRSKRSSAAPAPPGS
jgi:hypothetical protein